jgi:Fe-S-cluster containining protein
VNEALKRKALDLYADVDRQVAAAGPVCVASGRCCRFKEFGHVLYLSHLEARVLLDSAPAYEAPVTPEFCPFQKDNLCTAREPRPLACRIYFCDPAYQDTSHRITEEALGRLKALCAAEGIEWRYAPLHHFLNHPEDARV